MIVTKQALGSVTATPVPAVAPMKPRPFVTITAGADENGGLLTYTRNIDDANAQNLFVPGDVGVVLRETFRHTATLCTCTGYSVGQIPIVATVTADVAADPVPTGTVALLGEAGELTPGVPMHSNTLLGVLTLDSTGQSGSYTIGVGRFDTLWVRMFYPGDGFYDSAVSDVLGFLQS